MCLFCVTEENATLYEYKKRPDNIALKKIKAQKPHKIKENRKTPIAVQTKGVRISIGVSYVKR